LRIIAKKTLRKFWLEHPDCEEQLKAWYHEVLKADWQNSNELLQEYPKAGIIQGNRAIFKIKGNHYRLIVKGNYAYRIVWIRFIGTHADYDKIDPKEV